MTSPLPPTPPAPSDDEAIDSNFATIKQWEDEVLRRRSAAQQVSDWITARAGQGSVLVGHVVWFGGWIAANTGLIPGVAPFDAFPFPFLTMVVSLEAIFLALLVLASQNRLALQSDKRAHLDLQIDLLAEREMTAVLQMLDAVARHLRAPTPVTAEQLHEFATPTDLRRLTLRMDELSAEGEAPS